MIEAFLSMHCSTRAYLGVGGARASNASRMPGSALVGSGGSEVPSGATPPHAMQAGSGWVAAAPAHLRHTRRWQGHGKRTGARLPQSYSQPPTGH